MRKRSLAGLAALALTGGTLLGSPIAAQAADATVLYVKQNATACSDTGPGTAEQPFCTIGAAAAVVSAGQTVDVGGGNYRERVTIANSGTPDQPITFRAGSAASPILIGPTAGFVIDGQHDITIKGLRASGAVDVPSLDLHDASGIAIEGGAFGTPEGTTAPTIRLAGVTRSSLKRLTVTGLRLAGGLTMDAATAGVTVSSTTLTSGTSYGFADHSVGIRVAGPGNTILNNVVDGFTGAAVAIEAGAADTVVANNQVNGGAGYGIRNHGTAGTAIANNTVRDRCLDGIRVDGVSTGVSVQNNAVTASGNFNKGFCDPSGGDAVQIGIYDGAVGNTVVDYNNVYDYQTPSPAVYAWDGARMGLAAFRAASGQAAHDLETSYPRDNYDSANSAAPGYQDTDRIGTARADDPAFPNTGAGPVAYADRGAIETIRSPSAWLDATLDLSARSVTVDASASKPGLAPIASYQFTFGDGTVVTQTSPAASHQYATPGEYAVNVKVTGTDGRSDSKSEQVSVLRRTATVGLLALYNLRYVAPSDPAGALEPNQAGLATTAQFDLADAGSGQVALVFRATGKYVSADLAGIDLLRTTRTRIDTTERFTIVRNADRTVSLKAVASNRYVSLLSRTFPYLIANRASIGAWEKFHQVAVTDAARSLKAGANGRYVSADGAGTKPLIANRTIVGAWERFTIVRNSDGTVSLKAAANGRYVTAENAGAKPLIANRTKIGPWEKFTLG
ncbi:PKD domain-containing protein [Micromonospora sp. IBHARD004]|uniref:PKD domain-containing protein n=1 Tax=Micromonospora sp. IBHARD004 TaxID=3457764 RepID=UPI0040591431